MSEIINVTYEDPIYGVQHVVVWVPPGGGGGSYMVMINNRYQGQIVHTCKGWVSYVETPKLMQDDIDAILDVIRDLHPCG